MTGYKNPPKHSQYKPGQSGNLKGRPPGSTTNFRENFEEVFLKLENVKINGKMVKLTATHASLMQLRKLALGGNLAATRLLCNILIKMKYPDIYPEDFDDYDD